MPWIVRTLYDPTRREYAVLAWDTTEASADVTSRLALCILRARWLCPRPVGLATDCGLVIPLTQN